MLKNRDGATARRRPQPAEQIFGRLEVLGIQIGKPLHVGERKQHQAIRHDLAHRRHRNEATLPQDSSFGKN
jgi:hypothetical protein